MDCRTARMLLDFARPLSSELERDESEALEAHLADCPECGLVARLERQADHHIGQVMRAVPVPETLRANILGRLKVERDVRRHHRRWVGGAVAAAVAAVIALGVWLGIHSAQPAKVNLDQAVVDVSWKVTNPSGSNVEDLFQSKGVHFAAPADFNYTLLKDYDLVDFQGKRVPLLLFVQGEKQARVYCLSDKQFDLADLKTAVFARQNNDSDNDCKVALHPANQGYAFLIVYTGPSPRWLLLSEDEGGSMSHRAY